MKPINFASSIVNVSMRIDSKIKYKAQITYTIINRKKNRKMYRIRKSNR